MFSQESRELFTDEGTTKKIIRGQAEKGSWNIGFAPKIMQAVTNHNILLALVACFERKFENVATVWS